VRVIHLLQHTAGFDDMHFNEMYNVADPPDLPLEAVLKINPNSRVVRWQPGTRMAYSNPGYRIAAYLIEKITGEKYEDRIAEKIFKPVGMPTSSFVLTKDDEAMLAKGYRDRTGPPVPYSQIYLAAVRQSPHLGAGARPMGAPAAELGRDRNRSRDRSRISQQHGDTAHDRGVVCGTAHRLRQRHRELAGRRLPMLGMAAASTVSLALRLLDVARRRLRHPA
jgi:CubicO group peptidase (beta-lactamase class C family)